MSNIKKNKTKTKTKKTPDFLQLFLFTGKIFILKIFLNFLLQQNFMPTSLRKLCKKELSLFVHYPTTYKWCHGAIYTALLQNVCIKQYKDNRLSIVRKYLQLKTGLRKIKGMFNDKIVLSKPKSILLSSHYLMSKL